MQSPLDTYKYNKRIIDIGNMAYERLYENYLKLNLQGRDKLIEIDSTDQESVLKKFNFGLPIPGMIYIFYHLNDKIVSILRNEKLEVEFKYHDISPILFCTYYHSTNKTIGGLNLNLLPENERLKFLIAYHERYKDYFKEVEKLTENNKEALNKEYIKLVLSGKGQKMIKIFNKTQNAFFDFAYRSYKIENIRKLRMIEFEEWQFIPFFSPAQAFKKIGLQTIYTAYYDNKNKTT